LYRAHLPHNLVVQVVTLLAHGCPVQAIVAAFGLEPVMHFVPHFGPEMAALATRTPHSGVKQPSSRT
jgi:hypothetical protein